MIEQLTLSTNSQSLISGLRLKNFKSVAAADIELGPLTILVGMNSSGKSSVLQAIRLMQQGEQGTTAEGVFPLNSSLIRMGTITDVRTIQAAEDTEVGIGLNVSLPEAGTVGWDLSLGGVVPGDRASTFLRQVMVSMPSVEGPDTRITMLLKPKSRQSSDNEVWSLGNLQPEQKAVNWNSLVGGRLEVRNRNGRSQFDVATELRHLIPGTVIIEQPALAAVVAKQIDDVLSNQHVPKALLFEEKWLWELISNDAYVIDDDDVTSIKDLWGYEAEANRGMCVITRDRSGMLLGRSVRKHVIDVEDPDDLLHQHEVQFGNYEDCESGCWEIIRLRLSWQVASTPEGLARILADLVDIYMLRWSYGIDLDTLDFRNPLEIDYLSSTGLVEDCFKRRIDLDEFDASLFALYVNLVHTDVWEQVALTRQLLQELKDPLVRGKVATQLTEQLKTRISHGTWKSRVPPSFKGRSMAITQQIESGKSINHPWESSCQEELDQTGESLRHIIGQVQYLGPLREEPKAANEATTHHLGSVGPRGEDTVAVIRERARSPVVVPLPNRAAPTSTTLIEALRAWVTHLGLVEDVETENLAALGLALKVKPHGMEDKLPLTSVGVGVSQLLPVLVLCLLSKPGSVILLEQPELHLHPALQQRLADFFIVISKSGRQLIVETHSEYMLSRLRRRIAEDPEDQLLDLAKVVFAERDQTTGLSTFSNIDLTPYGNITEWPKGFFDQASEDERQTILGGLKKRRQKTT